MNPNKYRNMDLIFSRVDQKAKDKHVIYRADGTPKPVIPLNTFVFHIIFTNSNYVYEIRVNMNESSNIKVALEKAKKFLDKHVDEILHQKKRAEKAREK